MAGDGGERMQASTTGWPTLQHAATTDRCTVCPCDTDLFSRYLPPS